MFETWNFLNNILTNLADEDKLSDHPIHKMTKGKIVLSDGAVQKMRNRQSVLSVNQKMDSESCILRQKSLGSEDDGIEQNIDSEGQNSIDNADGADKKDDIESEILKFLTDSELNIDQDLDSLERKHSYL